MHPHTGHSRGVHAGLSGRGRRLEGLLGAWQYAIWVLHVINNVTDLQYYGTQSRFSSSVSFSGDSSDNTSTPSLFTAVGSCHCLSAAFALKSESSSLESPPSNLHLAPLFESLVDHRPLPFIVQQLRLKALQPTVSAIPSTLLKIFFSAPVNIIIEGKK